MQVTTASLQQDRAALTKMVEMMRPPLQRTPRLVCAPSPHDAADIALRVFVPPGELRRRRAILDIHGGGFVMGAAAMNDAKNEALAQTHDAVIVSVDYRLAPETPFPGPLEDCHAALAWMVANADSLGIDTQRIAVMGASAGGGLAAALAQWVRDRGDLPLAAQFLIYPMIDHRSGTAEEPEPNPSTGEFIWTRAHNAFGWAAMRGNAPLDPGRLGHFSPFHAKTLAGLAPAFIAVGTLDLFLDEDVGYAMRLMREGVPAELHVYPGAPHGFDFMAQARVSRQLAADLSAALARL